MTELFSHAEYDARLAALRCRMDERALELVILSSPENIFYLTGLHDWGYFAPHMLVVPREGEPVLVTRAMKRATIENQVKTASFEGHSDSETAADAVLRVLMNLRRPKEIGLEMWSSGLPYALAVAIQSALPEVRWIDITGLVDGLRHVASPAEQVYIRAAARVTDAAMAAGLEAVREGANEAEIAAACQSAMTEAGGTFPGFGPFVRSSSRLYEEHSTWSDARLKIGDAVLFEVSGCVARYHAPLGRLVHVGAVSDDSRAMASVARDAFDAALAALRDGTFAREVYGAWQGVLNRAGLNDYHRHHCGYLVGIGVPPSWIGGPKPAGLSYDSDLVIQTGMTFHVHSWLMGTGRGDFFISNAVLLGESGPEVLTRAPEGVIVR
jgi:Xaa-Pro dipeptidase